MAISTTFTWTIQDCKRDLSDGFITEATCALTGVAKSDSVGIATMKSPTVVGFGTVRPSPMVAYADVTEANVISWIETGLGTTDLNRIKENLNIRLAYSYNPPAPTTGEGIPW